MSINNPYRALAKAYKVIDSCNDIKQMPMCLNFTQLACKNIENEWRDNEKLYRDKSICLGHYHNKLYTLNRLNQLQGETIDGNS